MGTPLREPVALISHTVEAAGWLAGWAAYGRPRHLETREQYKPRDPRTDSKHVPTISLIVPARNEARRLPHLLARLETDRSLGATWELIVVDDASTDGTGRLAAAAGAQVISTAPPPGWNGKAWACWTGAHAARGSVLVFLDADTRPAPGFISQLAGRAQELGGMVSVQPYHCVHRWYEQLSAVANVVALMAGTGSPAGRPRYWWRGPVGFGPAVAVPASAYMRAGGHERAKSAVAEDLALAQAIHMDGNPVAAFCPGRDASFIEYRMYPQGLLALIEGWTKNLAAGARAVPPVRAALVSVWVAGAILAVTRFAGAPLPYGLYAVQMTFLMRRAGRFHPAMGVFYPVPLGMFVFLFGRSTLCRLTGRNVRWRGRPVQA
jgi:4,4'-diaponeurosporenoate glycosyltransferase